MRNEKICQFACKLCVRTHRTTVAIKNNWFFNDSQYHQHKVERASREIEKKNTDSLFFSYTSKNHFNTSIWNYYPLFQVRLCDHFTTEPNIFANYSLFMWRQFSLSTYSGCGEEHTLSSLGLWVGCEAVWNVQKVLQINFLIIEQQHSLCCTNDEWRRQTQYKVRILKFTRHLEFRFHEILYPTARNAMKPIRLAWMEIFVCVCSPSSWLSADCMMKINKKVNRFLLANDPMLRLLNHQCEREWMELHVGCEANNRAQNTGERKEWDDVVGNLSRPQLQPLRQLNNYNRATTNHSDIDDVSNFSRKLSPHAVSIEFMQMLPPPTLLAHFQ